MINSGKPLEHAFAFAIVVPTIVFLLARSAIGYCRWRLQRELWRRDVERLTGARLPTPVTITSRVFDAVERRRKAPR